MSVKYFQEGYDCDNLNKWKQSIRVYSTAR